MHTLIRYLYWENGWTITNIYQAIRTPEWPAAGLYVGQVMLLSDLVGTLLELNPLEWWRWWEAHHDKGPDLVTHQRVCVLSTGTPSVAAVSQTRIFVQCN